MNKLSPLVLFIVIIGFCFSCKVDIEPIDQNEIELVNQELLLENPYKNIPPTNGDISLPINILSDAIYETQGVRYKVSVIGDSWTAESDSVNVTVNPFIYEGNGELLLRFDEAVPSGLQFSIAMEFLLEDINNQQEDYIYRATYRFRSFPDLSFITDIQAFWEMVNNGEQALPVYEQLNITSSVPVNKVHSLADDFDVKFESNIQSVELNGEEIGAENFGFVYDEISGKSFFINKSKVVLDTGNYKISFDFKLYYSTGGSSFRQVDYLLDETHEFSVVANAFDVYESLSPNGSADNYINNALLIKVDDILDLSNSYFTEVNFNLGEVMINNGGGTIANEVYISNDDIYVVPSTNYLENSEVNVELNSSFEFRHDDVNYIASVEQQNISTWKFQVGTDISYPIQENFIQTSYPYMRQRHFLVDESSKGAFQLNFITNEVEQLISASNSRSAKFKAGSDSIIVAASYDVNSKTFLFDIPQGLKTNLIYSFELVLDQNTTLYKNYFKTSRHRSFTEKINQVFGIDNRWSRPTGGGREYGHTLTLAEPFDDFEKEILVVAKNEFDNNVWYQNNIYAEMYTEMPNVDFVPSWRNVEERGLPPIKGFDIRSSGLGILTDNEINSMTIQEEPQGQVAFVCLNDIVVRKDFFEFRSWALGSSTNSEFLERFIETDYLPLTSELIPFKIQYQIPILDNKVTSEKLMEF